jgi:hypothetical protein
MYKRLDEPASMEVAQQIKSQAKSSFENAYRAAIASAGATYVQGFLVVTGKPLHPIEHSWIELDDRIIDPTLPHFHKQSEALYYFPAQHLTVEQLNAAVEEAKEDYPEDNPLPIYGDAPYEYYGDVMLGGKAYLEAYQAAVAKCQELSRQIADRN